jgi:phosphatidylserine/phosphatidylglycerophosphate/cardiolipin synthase-like enzyme
VAGWKPQPRALAALAWLVALSAAAQELDRMYFRDGSMQAGKVLSEDRGIYMFRAGNGGGSAPIGKERVRFVIYGEAAEDRLGLVEARAHCTAATPVPVQVLPARDFGREAVAAVRGATSYVYVMTYNLSGSQSGVIAEFYEALQERARDGVKVYVIAPGGSRAHAAVKIRSMNFAETLAASGVQVRFLTDTKVQHKKLLIVDNRRVFLGSSNLTSAAVGDNLELNVAVEEPAFVEEAVKDFRALRARAKAPHEVGF